MATTQEQKDVIEIKGEIGRIRHHQDLQKQVNETNTKLLTDIKNALVGSELNGNKGLVNKVEAIEKKQDLQEETLSSHRLYFKQIGVIISAVIAIVVGLIIRISIK